jgi:hypothetical protein
MLLLASELPFQTVDNALNACLEDIDRHADGSPTILSIGKDAQDTNQCAGAIFIVIVSRRLVRQQPNIELLQLEFGELREMFLKNFAHGIIHGMNRAASVRDHQLLFAENFDQNGSLGCTLRRSQALEVDLIINFTAEHSKGFEIIVAATNRSELE